MLPLIRQPLTAFQRILEPEKLAASVERLPDWSTPSLAFGNAAQDHSGQLLEESPDLLLALQLDLTDASKISWTTEKSRSEAYMFFAEFWPDVVNKLSDPETTADKIIDELLKLPEHLLLLLGGAALERLRRKSLGKRDDDSKLFLPVLLPLHPLQTLSSLRVSSPSKCSVLDSSSETECYFKAVGHFDESTNSLAVNTGIPFRLRHGGSLLAPKGIFPGRRSFIP